MKKDEIIAMLLGAFITTGIFELSPLHEVDVWWQRLLIKVAIFVPVYFMLLAALGHLLGKRAKK